MISFSEIRAGDIIRVLVVIDDVEDELYAKVSDNRGDHFEIYYFEETTKTYKGAVVHELESDLNIISTESVSEHYPDGETIFKHVKDNYYVMIDDVNSSDDSVVYDESDDSGSDLTSFVVSDGECELPPDHKAIDREWSEWIPKSEGAKRFKNTVDNLDTRMRHVNLS
jgi:hypothetical protein